MVSPRVRPVGRASTGEVRSRAVGWRRRRQIARCARGGGSTPPTPPMAAIAGPSTPSVAVHDGPPSADPDRRPCGSKRGMARAARAATAAVAATPRTPPPPAPPARPRRDQHDTAVVAHASSSRRSRRLPGDAVDGRRAAGQVHHHLHRERVAQLLRAATASIAFTSTCWFVSDATTSGSAVDAGLRSRRGRRCRSPRTTCANRPRSRAAATSRSGPSRR